MIHSFSHELNTVRIPNFTGEVKMLPFNLKTLSEIPEQFKKLVKAMIKHLPVKAGTAYLTVDGKTIQSGTTQRRGGPHIDGNYLPLASDGWGGQQGGGNGWKVGEGGRTLSSKHHRLSYETKTGGMLICSTYSACKGWIGEFRGKAGVGGDCSKLKLKNDFMLKANTVYYGNSQFIHESLPVEKNVHRTMARITLPADYPQLIKLVHHS